MSVQQISFNPILSKQTLLNQHCVIKKTIDIIKSKSKGLRIRLWEYGLMAYGESALQGALFKESQLVLTKISKKNNKGFGN